MVCRVHAVSTNWSQRLQTNTKSLASSKLFIRLLYVPERRVGYHVWISALISANPIPWYPTLLLPHCRPSLSERIIMSKCNWLKLSLKLMIFLLYYCLEPSALIAVNSIYRTANCIHRILTEHHSIKRHFERLLRSFCISWHKKWLL